MTRTVKLKVAFGPGDGVTKVLRSHVAVPEPARPLAEPGRVARLLALAYRVEQLIDDGVLADYREAARKLSVSAPHLSHLVALADLAPSIQAALLLGHMDIPERQLRPIAKLHEWKVQAEAVRLLHSSTK